MKREAGVLSWKILEVLLQLPITPGLPRYFAAPHCNPSMPSLDILQLHTAHPSVVSLEIWQTAAALCSCSPLWWLHLPLGGTLDYRLASVCMSFPPCFP